MKTVLALLAALAISRGAAAAPMSDADIRKGVTDAVLRYVGSIACSPAALRPEAVLTLEPLDQSGPSLPKYALLWSGDLGCWGGAGSERTHLAIATFNTGRFVVRPELSSPVIAFESPARFVARVVSNSADSLVLEGMEYGPGDARCCASIPVRFSLRVDAGGNWKLTDKARLEK